MYSGKTCCTCVPGFTGCDCSERKYSFERNTKDWLNSNVNTYLVQGILNSCLILRLAISSLYIYSIEYIVHGYSIIYNI